MKILLYNGKLVEEIGYTLPPSKVVFLRYIREEDKDKCPHCQRPIEREISIVEDCLNWKQSIKGVETLEPPTPKE